MGNPVTLSELEKALDDLLMQEAPPDLLETDITVMRLARRAKCGGAKAKKLLDEWTAAGKVEYIGKRREPRGHKLDAWRLK
jgi:hypothetical protein